MAQQTLDERLKKFALWQIAAGENIDRISLRYREGCGGCGCCISVGHCIDTAPEEPEQKESPYDYWSSYEEPTSAEQPAPTKIPATPMISNDYNKLGINATDPNQALEYFLKAHELDKNSGNIAYNVGITYKEIGDTVGAVHWLTHSLSLKLDDEVKEIRHRYIGSCERNSSRAFELNKRGLQETDSWQALLLFIESVLNDPTERVYFYNCGVKSEKRGSPKHARIWYQDTLKIDPNYESAIKALKILNGR